MNLIPNENLRTSRESNSNLLIQTQIRIRDHIYYPNIKILISKIRKNIKLQIHTWTETHVFPQSPFLSIPPQLHQSPTSLIDFPLFHPTFSSFPIFFRLSASGSILIFSETTCTQSRQHHHLRRVRRARETRREPGPSRPIVLLTHFRLVSRLTVSHLLFIYRPSPRPLRSHIPLFAANAAATASPSFRRFANIFAKVPICAGLVSAEIILITG